MLRSVQVNVLAMPRKHVQGLYADSYHILMKTSEKAFINGEVYHVHGVKAQK
jgi:hypothetical protein